MIDVSFGHDCIHMNSLLNLSGTQLRRAAELKEQIDNLNSELEAILAGAESSVPSAKGVGRGRGMSAAGRARIAAAARARWAKIKAAKGGSSAADNGGAKPKRTMSAAAKAKIAAAAKARWAKLRAAKAGK